MTSTLPRSFPEATIKDIGREVLESFRKGRNAQLRLTEIIIHYATLKLLARELRGGAIVFIMPQATAKSREL